MLYVGQKVVCIKKPLSGIVDPSRWQEAIVGNIYTIRGIDPKVLRPQYGVALIFEEIVNPIYGPNGEEYGYYSHRFRPLVEKKTDISIFTAMLNSKQKELIE